MNEIVRVRLNQKPIPKIFGPSVAFMDRLNGEFARQAETLAWRSDNTVKERDAWLKAMREAEQATPRGGRVIPFDPPSPDDILQDAIASGERMLANPLFQKLCVELTPFVSTATVAQVKYELRKLLVAFRTKDDSVAFTLLLLEEIISEQPSWLMLAMACRKVRQNSIFRPSIAEVLDALHEVEWDANRFAGIVQLPKYVAALRKHLAEAKRLRPPKPTPLQQALVDYGCFVSHDQDGYFVTDLKRDFAGPFATETEAWSWLQARRGALQQLG